MITIMWTYGTILTYVLTIECNIHQVECFRKTLSQKFMKYRIREIVASCLVVQKADESTEAQDSSIEWFSHFRSTCHIFEDNHITVTSHEYHAVSIHRQMACMLTILFRLISKKMCSRLFSYFLVILTFVLDSVGGNFPTGLVSHQMHKQVV